MKRKIYLVVLFNALAFAFLATAVGADPKPSGVQGSAPPPARVGAAAQAPEAPVGSGFTYQGRLKDGNNPANGSYDLQFTLYDAAYAGNVAGGPLTLLNQTVTDGLFTVQLDFGPSAFQGSARWLAIAVRQAGGGSYTALSPRQPLTAAPYALSLMPGAVITGTLAASPVLSVTNAGTGGTGLYGNAPTGFGLYGTSQSTGGAGVYGNNPANLGVYGVGSYGVYGSGTGYGVYGTASDIGGSGVTGSASGSSGTGVSGTGGQTGVFGIGGTYGVNGTSSSATGYGVFGHDTASGGTGVYGRDNASGGTGVYGLGDSYGVSGAGNAVGVYGSGTYGLYGSGSTGVYGSGTSTGIWGSSSTSGAYGVRGDALNGTGVYGTSSSAAGAGVYGLNNTNIGVYGVGNYGMYGTTNNTNGVGVLGEANTGSSALGVWGRSNSNIGVYGTSGNTGVYGSGNLTGVYGFGPVGVQGQSDGSTYSRAGAFYGDMLINGTTDTFGNVYINGDMYVTGHCCLAQQGSYRIDDPLDPANKYLNQSAVESPDMLDVAGGNVVLDAQGKATVTLPDWFQAANRDFRYEFAPIGAPAPDLYVAQEVQNNNFILAGGKPGMKVSWQVAGVRQDPYANDHPLQVEQPKPSDEKGTYLYPKGYGQPDSKGVDYQKQQKLKLQAPPPVQTPDPPHGK